MIKDFRKVATAQTYKRKKSPLNPEHMVMSSNNKSTHKSMHAHTHTHKYLPILIPFLSAIYNITEKGILESLSLDLVKKILGNLESLSAHNHSCWQDMWWKMELFILINCVFTHGFHFPLHTRGKACIIKGLKSQRQKQLSKLYAVAAIWR